MSNAIGSLGALTGGPGSVPGPPRQDRYRWVMGRRCSPSALDAISKARSQPLRSNAALGARFGFTPVTPQRIATHSWNELDARHFKSSHDKSTRRSTLVSEVA